MFYELFSKRRSKAEKSGLDDVYQYETVPSTLRVQVQQILNEAIGPQYQPDAYSIHAPQHNAYAWQMVRKILCKELGVHQLSDRSAYDLDNRDVLEFIGRTDISGFLDALEVCCRCIELVIGEWPEYKRNDHGITQAPDDAIVEINYRVREVGLGFAYTDGQIIRLDSEYVHDEVIKPALTLLRDKRLKGPQSEFLQAHSHYRAGEYPQAITEAAKAFESTLKAVCDLKGWSYEKGSRVTDLLKRVKSEGLWPDYLDGSFDQLIGTLSSGLPKVRNEDGAHGQGAEIRRVPAYIAAYALHLAAAKIVLVSEAAAT